MDKKNLAENAYKDFRHFLVEDVFSNYRENENNQESKSDFDSVIFYKGVELLENYLGLIKEPILKVICLNRLKQDIINLIANLEGDLMSLSNSFDLSDTIQNNESKDIANTKNIRGLFLNLTYYLEDELQILEFELIGATPTPRKNKPTREQKLALNQNELMYLFMKLGAKGIFTKPDKIHIARGIQILSDFSANKTREKGTNMNLNELENIKTILDDVSASLKADIKQSKAETKK